jgi:hypothetical protein
VSAFSEGVEGKLLETIDLYKRRNAEYKDNFMIVGDVMHALFPGGIPPVESSLDFQKWHLFELFIVKLTRFTQNYVAGHPDSLKDMRVYLAMLEELYEPPTNGDMFS